MIMVEIILGKKDSKSVIVVTRKCIMMIRKIRRFNYRLANQ